MAKSTTTSTSQNAVDTLNAIHTEASPTYQQAVPLATLDNVTEVSSALFNSLQPNVYNEFLTRLTNQVIKTVITLRNFDNYLSVLRKYSDGIGYTVREVYTNPVISADYDLEATTEFLQDIPPTSWETFHTISHKKKFRTSITQPLIKQAFNSYDALGEYIQSVTNSIYNGAYIWEFSQTKNLFNNNTQNMTKISVGEILTSDDAKKIMIDIITLVAKFRTPSPAYNMGNRTGLGAGYIMSWVNKSAKIICMIDAKVKAQLDVLGYSGLFHTEYANLGVEFIPVDDLGLDDTNKSIMYYLFDENLTYISDNLREFRTFENPSTLNTYQVLHLWQTYSMSPFANVVVCVKDENQTNTLQLQQVNGDIVITADGNVTVNSDTEAEPTT